MSLKSPSVTGAPPQPTANDRSYIRFIPANKLNREDAGFDVPIAVGILSAIKMPGSYLKMPGVLSFEYN